MNVVSQGSRRVIRVELEFEIDELKLLVEHLRRLKPAPGSRLSDIEKTFASLLPEGEGAEK